LGVRRYRITIQTQGGHSWVNFGRPSAVHELARLVTRLETLPVPSQPRSSYNVGVIQGGTSVNTIAANASLELDLRSQDPQTLDHMASHVEQLVRDAKRLGEQPVEALQELIGNRPAGGLPADHPLVRLAERTYADQGVLPHIDFGSTDANAPLSQGYPAVCVGLTTGGGAHTLGEYIDLAPLRLGMAAVTHLVESIYSAY
jgi:acetylornithine deacetylase/succinyl-diaminopimelate desuccinylase-like protein